MPTPPHTACPRLPAASPFLARLESALLRSLERRDGTLHHTASILGVSSRTLQRRLREHDTSFSEVKGRVFQHIATAAIRDGASTGEIARRLGYASRRAFVRAFRSWLGMTPAAFRGAPRALTEGPSPRPSDWRASNLAA